jgi:hypothetical protein
MLPGYRLVFFKLGELPNNPVWNENDGIWLPMTGKNQPALKKFKIKIK